MEIYKKVIQRPELFNTSFSVTHPHCLLLSDDAASESIILSCLMSLYEKMKNYSLQSFKECLFFVFCLFCLVLLYNMTLHVMFYTHICYWNTFQYKYLIQITFHAVKPSHARLISKEVLYHSFSLLYKYCCRSCIILCTIFKISLFIAVLCRPLFMKHAHYKSLLKF